MWAVGDVRHVLGDADLPAGGELEIRLLPDESHNFFIGRGPDIVVAGIADGDVFTELGRRRRPLPLHRGRRRHDRPDGRRHRAVDGSVLIRSFEYVGADDPAVLS